MAAGCKSFVRPWRRANPIGQRPGRDDCCAVTAISKNLINSRKKDRDRKCERQPEVDRFETWRKDEDGDGAGGDEATRRRRRRRRRDGVETGEEKLGEKEKCGGRQEGKIP